MLETIGELYVGGTAIDWTGVDRDYRRSRVALPTYPFQRQTYWPTDLPSATATGLGVAGLALRPRLGADPVERTSAAFLTTPDGIVSTVAPGVDELYEEYGASVYNELYPALDRVCAAYIVAGLRDRRSALRAGDSSTTAALADRLGVVPAHRRLLARLLETLAEDGYLQKSADGWRVVRDLTAGDPERLMKHLLERFPTCRAELAFTARSAPALADVLRGSRDPLQVLFPGGSLEAAEALYERAPGLRLFNTLVARSVRSAIANRPQERKLRVLEIGAGTGGTTTYVLPSLPADATEYVYTDVGSPLRRAQ